MKPLRLKVEVAKRERVDAELSSYVARIWVDTSVFHLDQPYDYLIPTEFLEFVETGIRVQVPFGGREVEGIVLEKALSPDHGVLKPISKVISPIPVASTNLLTLISEVSLSWASNPYDVIRSAIPPRVATVDREVWTPPSVRAKAGKSKSVFLQLPSHRNPFHALAELIRKSSTSGSSLVIVPERRSIARLLEYFPDSIVLDSSLERSTRYRNFLRAKFSTNQIVIGTRNAIFADIPDLTQIIIFDEGSEHLYEQRSPGWNARDVALIRTRIEDISFVAIGFSPSAEVARRIEIGEIDFRASKSRVDVESFQQEFQELLPGRIISAIRSALKSGPVLFLAARKGYSQAISCSKCRNISLCLCGSRLLQRSSTSPIECSLCDLQYPDWVCSWCSTKVPFLLSRGTTRYAQEIGRAFPGTRISISEGDTVLEDFAISDGIVIATPGSAPYLKDGYKSVVVLDADSLLNESDLKALERAQQLIFSQGGFIGEKGRLLLVSSHSNPIVGALASWKPSLLMQRELSERRETDLPPFSKSVAIDISESEAPSLIRGLEIAKGDGRLPSETRVLGPLKIKGDLQRILLLAPQDKAELLVSLMHEYQRRRSTAKKSLLTMRIDPYSLTK